MYQNELLDGINLCSAQVRPEHSRGSITSPYNWPSEGVITMKQVKMNFFTFAPAFAFLLIALAT